jgi:hypothetical protein
MTLWDAYRAKLAESIATLGEGIAAGKAKDHAEYMAMVRERKALKQCLQDFNDLLRNYEGESA